MLRLAPGLERRYISNVETKKHVKSESPQNHSSTVVIVHVSDAYRDLNSY